MREQLRFLRDPFERWPRCEELFRRCAAVAASRFTLERTCATAAGLVVAELFPNVVAKCGRPALLRIGDSPLCSRYEQFDNSCADLNDPGGSGRVSPANEFIRRAPFRRGATRPCFPSTFYYHLPLFTRFRDVSPSLALVTAHYTLCARREEAV